MKGRKTQCQPVPTHDRSRARLLPTRRRCFSLHIIAYAVARSFKVDSAVRSFMGGLTPSIGRSASSSAKTASPRPRSTSRAFSTSAPLAPCPAAVSGRTMSGRVRGSRGLPRSRCSTTAWRAWGSTGDTWRFGASQRCGRSGGPGVLFGGLPSLWQSDRDVPSPGD